MALPEALLAKINYDSTIIYFAFPAPVLAV
jgi:hypothetical protein